MIPQIKRIILWTVGLVIIAATAWGAKTQLFAPTPPIPTTSGTSLSSSTPTESVVTCSELQAGIVQEITQYNQSQHLEWSPAGATFDAGSYINNEKLYKVFYSPGLDTCIKVVIDQSLMQTNKGLIVHEESYNFYNAFTGESVDWLYTIRHGYRESGIDGVLLQVHQVEIATSSPII